MKKNIFLLLLPFFIICLDLTIGRVLKKFYFSESSKENDPFIYSITKSTDDIIVFGSSRAKHHYNAKMMEDSLLLKAYNFGYGGQNNYFHEILLRNILLRHKPKIILLDLMYIDFEVTESSWDKDKLDVLIPFCQFPLIGDEISTLDAYHKLKSLSCIYPFNSQIYTIVKNNYFPYSNHFNGFIPLNDKKWSKELTIESTSIQGFKYDHQKIEIIEGFIKLCKENNIKLLLFISPLYKKYENGLPFKDLLMYLQEKHKINVFDFRNNSEFLNSNYFSDPMHLNSDGAEIYTKNVINILKKADINLP
jgi:hypothetical protein